MSLRKFAKLMGYFFIIIGILGFIPGITENNHLFGIFHVNSAHNLFHILTGFTALGIVHRTPKAHKIFFQLCGVVYTVVAFMGFYHLDQPIFGLIANNQADSWLHLILGVAFLYLGFLYKHERKA